MQGCISGFGSKDGTKPRVGIINAWTQEGINNDPCDFIITSRMAVSDVVVNKTVTELLAGCLQD